MLVAVALVVAFSVATANKTCVTEGPIRLIPSRHDLRDMVAPLLVGLRIFLGFLVAGLALGAAVSLHDWKSEAVHGGGDDAGNAGG